MSDAPLQFSEGLASAAQTDTNSNTNKDKPAIRVLAADSTRMNSQMLADVLARDKRFHVLPTQTSADTILTVAENEKPDVVLLSPLLGEDAGRGFKIARELRAPHPALRVVMLLDRSERSTAVEAFRAGASGIFCRSESLKFLPRCISSVHAGQVWANSEELKFLLDALAEAVPSRTRITENEISILSRREQDVVRGVADGLSNREIAQELKLTEHTVKNYLFRIFDKLGRFQPRGGRVVCPRTGSGVAGIWSSKFWRSRPGVRVTPPEAAKGRPERQSASSPPPPRKTKKPFALFCSFRFQLCYLSVFPSITVRCPSTSRSVDCSTHYRKHSKSPRVDLLRWA